MRHKTVRDSETGMFPFYREICPRWRGRQAYPRRRGHAVRASKAPARRDPKLACRKPFPPPELTGSAAPFTRPGAGTFVIRPSGKWPTNGTIPLQANPVKYPCRYSFCSRLNPISGRIVSVLIFVSCEPGDTFEDAVQVRSGRRPARPRCCAIWFSQTETDDCQKTKRGEDQKTVLVRAGDSF